jgi:hypothetical protein
MGSFILVQFAGDDAADVLTRVLAGIGGGDDLDNDTEHDVESETERVVGFSRNPEPETDDEPEKGGEEGDAK